LIAGRSLGEVLFRRDDGRAWKRAEQLRPMREACERAGIIPAVGFMSCGILTGTTASVVVPVVRARVSKDDDSAFNW
jgi:hypothetical protein